MVLNHVVPAFGCAVAFIMFASPMKAVLQVRKTQILGVSGAKSFIDMQLIIFDSLLSGCMPAAVTRYTQPCAEWRCLPTAAICTSARVKKRAIGIIFNVYRPNLSIFQCLLGFCCIWRPLELPGCAPMTFLYLLQASFRNSFFFPLNVPCKRSCRR